MELMLCLLSSDSGAEEDKEEEEGEGEGGGREGVMEVKGETSSPVPTVTRVTCSSSTTPWLWRERDGSSRIPGGGGRGTQVIPPQFGAKGIGHR